MACKIFENPFKIKELEEYMKVNEIVRIVLT